jgi:hypothetical protein
MGHAPEAAAARRLEEDASSTRASRRAPSSTSTARRARAMFSCRNAASQLAHCCIAARAASPGCSAICHAAADANAAARRRHGGRVAARVHREGGRVEQPNHGRRRAPCAATRASALRALLRPSADARALISTDMDLSLRAYLQGWRFVFLYDVTCLNEVPASYDAYRKQQHRWSCGPMQLWRKATSAVWHSTNISWAQKLYLNIFFFGTRLFATHVVSFVFYCTLVPIAVIAPEVRIPFWALVYMPLLVTCSTVAFTPRGWMHTVAYVLFENAMCVVKLGAMISGLLELSDAHEWVVTTKLGNWAAAKAKSGIAKAGAVVAAVVPAKVAAPLQKRKLYKSELAMSALFLVAAACGIAQGRWQYAVFLTLQGATFAAFGLSCGVDGQKRTCCA